MKHTTKSASYTLAQAVLRGLQMPESVLQQFAGKLGINVLIARKLLDEYGEGYIYTRGGQYVLEDTPRNRERCLHLAKFAVIFTDSREIIGLSIKRKRQERAAYKRERKAAYYRGVRAEMARRKAERETNHIFESGKNLPQRKKAHMSGRGIRLHHFEKDVRKETVYGF